MPTQRKQFFDSRAKYLGFVNNTDEKSRIAFYLAERLAPPAAPTTPFYIFDGGVGEGTVISTFLAAAHNAMPNVPIVVTAKEISADDLQILLAALPNRFAEHESLVFNVTNLTYRELRDLPNADFDFEFDYVRKSIRGRSAYEFSRELMALSDFINKNWALDVQPNGALRPRRKVFLTLYRDDYSVLLDPLLPRHKRDFNNRFHHIIASQPFRLRQPPDLTAQRVLAPMLEMLRPDGEMALFYASGRDFTRDLLRQWYPDIDAYANSAPRDLVAAIHRLPAPPRFAHEVSALTYGFKNLNLSRKDFSLMNISALWDTVTYVGQISDDEQRAVTINPAFIRRLSAALGKIKHLNFKNHVIHFTRKSD